MTNAAFINDVAEEGSKADAVRHLRQLWADLCAARDEIARLHEATAWQPIETAPKDGTDIWVYYSHDADPYQDPGDPDRLTPYGAWAEGGDFLDGKGMCVAAWQQEQWEATDEYGSGYYLPAYWFAHQMGDYEYVVNPTHWMPLPEPPEVPQ